MSVWWKPSPRKCRAWLGPGSEPGWIRGLVVLTLVWATGWAPALVAQDPPAPNRVVEQLHQNRPAIGTFTRTRRPDLDFIVIDTQYGELDIETMRQILEGVRAQDGAIAAAPIVRIPLSRRADPQPIVSALLDLGVMGVMFPNIETADQAATAIDALRDGPRGRGTAVTATGVWPLDAAGQRVAMLQIESQAGIAHLEEILRVPGLGVIFLGPTDLAASIGAEGPASPVVEALVQDVLRACLATDIPCGYPIVASTREEADRETARRLREGFRVLAVMTTVP